MNTIAALADHTYRHDGDWFPWFPLVPLFFVGLWITVFAVLGRRLRRGSFGPWSGGEGVLAERYARGEIDEVEYRQRRDVLRSR